MKYRNKNSILIAMMIASALCIAVGAQDGASRNAEVPSTCAENEARLDRIYLQWSERTEPKSALIIVARLGTGERSSHISQLRLHNAKEYLLQLPVTEHPTIIVAEGERRTGAGHVEFYVDGKLVDTLIVGKNRPLCVDCCESKHIPKYGPLTLSSDQPVTVAREVLSQNR